MLCNSLELFFSITYTPVRHPGYLGLFVMLVLFTLYKFAQAAITKIHKMSGNVLPHSPGDWKFKIKVSRGLLPSAGCEREPTPCVSLVSWWFPGNLWCSSACSCITPVAVSIIPGPFPWVSVFTSSSYKVTNYLGLGHHPSDLILT